MSVVHQVPAPPSLTECRTKSLEVSFTGLNTGRCRGVKPLVDNIARLVNGQRVVVDRRVRAYPHEGQQTQPRQDD